MSRRDRLARPFVLFALVGFAACGGKVTEAALTSNPTPSSGAGAEVPSNTGGRTTPTPTATATATTTATAKPVPTGETNFCGALIGDSDAVLRAFGDAGAIAEYEIADVVEECSGAGGLHLTLARKRGCATPTTVHFGGHACYVSAPFHVGERVILGVTPEGGNASVLIPEWCLDGMTPWTGTARAIRRLAPGENAIQVLAAFGCGI